MAKIRRIVLDVLKPHQPNVVDFAISLAELADRCHVKIIVTEVDKKTENIILELTGDDVLFQMINEEIKKWGPLCTVLTRLRWRVVLPMKADASCVPSAPLPPPGLDPCGIHD